MRRGRGWEVKALWRKHASQGFLLSRSDASAVGAPQGDWATWDAAVAGHVVIYMHTGSLDGDRIEGLRALTNEGLRCLPSLPEGRGREQMTRLCLIGCIILDRHSGG